MALGLARWFTTSYRIDEQELVSLMRGYGHEPYLVTGSDPKEVHQAFASTIARAGLSKESRIGYSIGIGYPPDWGERTMSLRPGDKTVLQPGMTFHFMTGLWSDDMGLEITESLVITEGAPELLANVPRQLFVKD